MKFWLGANGNDDDNDYVALKKIDAYAWNVICIFF
jgi:hypothetical protein